MMYVLEKIFLLDTYFVLITNLANDDILSDIQCVIVVIQKNDKLINSNFLSFSAFFDELKGFVT